MKRALTDLLRSYRSETPSDAETALKILSFLENYADPFSRKNFAGHITASAWVVDETGKQALLTNHRKLGRWLQLGGHADGDPDVHGVALREAREESGLSCITAIDEEIFDLDVHRIPAGNHEPAHIHYDIRFLFRADGSQPITASADESHEVRWVCLAEIGALAVDESVLRMARKWSTVQLDGSRGTAVGNTGRQRTF